ncbi:MAG: UDP-N-acetylmuramate dehydrogenase [Candidatus Zixiibacteriota bacterium]|nr:MAG: UDP-N-acetylmuramate dehydrogenase [candidate division Zixibacteria bacterium]
MPKTADRLNSALGGRIEENVILSPHTSFGIGGPARYFFAAHTTSELVRAVRSARANGLRFFVLGGGSNILFDDAGFSGLVIKDNTDKFRIKGGIVFALSGTIVDRLVDATVEQGLGGMEYAAGIMGTIGGAVHGNAGAFGHAINEILESAVILSNDDKIEVVDNEYFKFAYRSSRLCSNGDTVLSVRLRLRAEDPLQLAETVKDRRKFRRERHPVNMGCAGSVFKNIRSLEKPDEVTPAGKLLEEAGVRGMSVGGAAVFDRHCNIIVNRGTATSEDVKKLVENMRNAVFSNFGIDLEREILYIEP